MQIFLGYGILININKKYGNLVKKMENVFILGNNKYSKTVQWSYEYTALYKIYKSKSSSNNNNNKHNGLYISHSKLR